MQYIGKNLWGKSAISYGCLVLLGTIATAGAVELEIQGKFVSSWIEKVGQTMETMTSSSSSSGSEVSTDQVLFPFTWVGGQVSAAATTVWPYIAMAVGYIPELFKTWDTLWQQIKSLLSTLIKPTIYQEFFKDLHLKIGRILGFAIADGEGRSKFFGLFGQENKDSTMAGLKFLFGSGAGNKKFRAKPEVLPYILSRWLMEPTKVTEKFEKLSKKIKSLTDKINSGSSSSSSSSDSNGYFYELDIPTTKEYLDIEGGWKEATFNLAWSAEIMAKINTGVDLTGGAKSWVSTIGSLFW